MTGEPPVGRERLSNDRSSGAARRAVAGGVVALTIVFAGCGGSGAEEQQASTSEAAARELQQRVDKLEREATEREEAAARREKAARKRERAARRATRRARAAKKRAEASRPSASEPTGQAGGGGITVPDVVGLDHQAAQDALQGEGLWMLDERDCTGQGRALVFDRNWEVVSTDPPAGSQVSSDDTITLCSVKQGEG